MSLSISAQIKFTDQSLDLAIEKAKKEKKYVFVDVYAEWCTPCKRMAATAFVDDSVATFYNAYFLNVRVDAEKNTGPEVKKKYKVNAYPTLLYITPDGELIKKVVGALSAKELLFTARNIIGYANTPIYAARKTFHTSKKTKNDWNEFLYVMLEEKEDSITTYLESYYKKFPELDLSNVVDRKAFIDYENNVNHDLSKQYIAHPELYDPIEFEQKMGKFIQNSMKNALDKNDFTVVEACLKSVYPGIQQVIKEDLPTELEYLDYLRAQYYKSVK